MKHIHPTFFSTITTKSCYTFWLLTFLCFSCRDYYDAEYPMPDTGFLVVEGFINNGQETTVIKLSRTTKLFDNPLPVPEKGATMYIESDKNDRFSMHETNEGTYVSEASNIIATHQYRLVINAKGKQYVSAYSVVQTTPDIDSITWQQNGAGVDFLVNAYDPTGNSKYYQWKFEETWESNSPYVQNLSYVADNQQQRIKEVWFTNPDRSPDTTIQRCWTTIMSRNLNLGSTEKLDKDVVHLPVNYVATGSAKMAVLYSILVKQYKLSEKAYNFFTQMKKNSERLGSIFDPQPSGMNGNITCITHPAEIAIGFVEVTQEKTKRLFVERRELPGWGYNTGCQSVVIDNHPDSIYKYGMLLVPTTTNITDTPPIVIVKFNAAPAACVDCRLGGGSNVKPSFWPN